MEVISIGFIVTSNEKEIWSPSLTVGNLFYAQIKLLEQIVEKDSGITCPFDDELDVDKEKLEFFLKQSLKFLEQNENLQLSVMLSGCLEVGIYLYYLASNNWLETPISLSYLKEKSMAMKAK